LLLFLKVTPDQTTHTETTVIWITKKVSGHLCTTLLHYTRIMKIIEI